MYKISLLAMSVAVVLTGCGSDDNKTETPIDPPPTETPSYFTVTAIDGYLQNAKVGVMTEQGCDTGDGSITTDRSGQAQVLEEHQHSTLCIEAVAGETIDSTRGIVSRSFELAAPAGTAVVNPMNHVVVSMMQKNTALTEAEAKQLIIEALVKSAPELKLTEALIFGDYHDSQVANTTEAQALNVVGEILVDHNNKGVEQQIELVEKVAEETINAISGNEGQLPEGFTPIVDIPSDGGPITVTPNHRPIVIGTLETVAIEYEDSIAPISVSALFEDPDQDGTLTYSLQSQDGLNGLAISSVDGMITGTPEVAGEYDYQIFATDHFGARSYPLALKVVVETPNSAPVLDPDVQADLQQYIDAMPLTEGEAITDTIDVTNLFIDADGDALTHSAKSSLDGSGFSTHVEDATVAFTGSIPRAAEAGAETLTVSVEDGVNPAVEAEFTLPQIEEAVIPPPPTPTLGFTLKHFDNGNWKMGSFARHDGEIGHASLTNSGGELAFCWGSNDDVAVGYKINISNSNAETVISSLATLDELPSYVDSGDGDCWPVDLRDGKLYSMEGSDELEYEMLYQHTTVEGGAQIILKIDGDELFWLDSTDTTFASTLDASGKVAAGKIEYDMTVEDEGDVDPALYYSAGEYQYSAAEFEYRSILPEGFYTPGTWVIEQDSAGRDIVTVVEAKEDQKTRRRYIQREFGDFYIAIKWSQEEFTRESPEYGLFSYEKQPILDVLEGHLPIIED
ncbi:putative Ig domain-containing protein [Vibrio cyclitrophicus]